MKTLRLRIVVERPPEGIDYALQKGSGSQYETEQRQRSGGGDLSFDFEVRCKGIDCRGPHVQGPPGGRFVYIDIGKSAGQFDSPWQRRLKVPLAGVSEDMTARLIEARVPGVGADGTPACATQRLLGGWRELTDI